MAVTYAAGSTAARQTVTREYLQTVANGANAALKRSHVRIEVETDTLGNSALVALDPDLPLWKMYVGYAEERYHLVTAVSIVGIYYVTRGRGGKRWTHLSELLLGIDGIAKRVATHAKSLNRKRRQIGAMAA